MRIRNVTLLLIFSGLFLGACAPDAPRGVKRGAADSLRVASDNFARLETVRVSLQLGSAPIVESDVRLPDAMHVIDARGEWIADASDVWRIEGGVAKRDSAGESVNAVREAIRIARGLKDAENQTFVRQEGAAGYLASVWTFTMNGRQGTVWLTTRDALPRLIEIGGSPASKTTYVYHDFNAWLVVQRPDR